MITLITGKPKVLIIDDERANIQVLAAALPGMDLSFATTGPKALDLATANPPDLILLDVVMPDMDGFEILRWLKSEPRTQHVPVIFVSAMTDLETEERGFALGAVEYIVKPISPAIFLAKILAWSRRSWSEPMKPRQTDRLKLDPSHRSAVGANKQEIKLTNLEFRLLHLLMSRPGYVFPAEEIIETVWGAEGDVALLKNVVYRLRKKLEEEASEAHLIKTWPRGYSFVDD